MTTISGYNLNMVSLAAELQTTTTNIAMEDKRVEHSQSTGGKPLPQVKSFLISILFDANSIGGGGLPHLRFTDRVTDVYLLFHF